MENQMKEILQRLNFGKGAVAISRLVEFSRENERILKTEYLRIGKETVGQHFGVSQEYAETLTNLLKYFTGNEGVFDLRKGIYLYGDYGLGKTTTFSVIRKLLAFIAPLTPEGKRYNPNGFLITSIEGIIDLYKKDGNLDYHGYRKESEPINLCINEFGKKIDDKIYGTSADQIINSLFMIRYELFQNGKLTHVTSNFHPDKLDVERIIADRMVEMFNFVEVKGTTFRK